MRAEFSEFSFGYAVTEELVAYRRSYDRISPPRFPTLRDERRLGYDVKLRLSCCLLYLQFKLCDVMVRNTAKEIADTNLPLTTPFLRMKLMPGKRSPQHQLLLDLERQGERVFYVAPRFYDKYDFCRHYQKRGIVRHSAFIMPSGIGSLPDDKPHHVSFDRFANSGWLLSEPTDVTGILSGDALKDRIQDDLKEERSAHDRGLTALQRMRRVLAERGDRERYAIRQSDDASFWPDEDYDRILNQAEGDGMLLRHLDFLARRDFGAFLVPIYDYKIEG